MILDDLVKSPLEIILCLLPLFIVIVIGFYTVAQWLKGNNRPLTGWLIAMVNISDKKLYGEKISEADNILLHNQITYDLIRWAKQDNGSEITENMRIAMSVYLLEFREHNSEAQNSDIFNKLFKSCCCELNPEEQAKLGKALTILIN